VINCIGINTLALATIKKELTLRNLFGIEDKSNPELLELSSKTEQKVWGSNPYGRTS
jgi:hypothetical protein